MSDPRNYKRIDVTFLAEAALAIMLRPIFGLEDFDGRLAAFLATFFLEDFFFADFLLAVLLTAFFADFLAFLAMVICSIR